MVHICNSNVHYRGLRMEMADFGVGYIFLENSLYVIFRSSVNFTCDAWIMRKHDKYKNEGNKYIFVIYVHKNNTQ